MTTVNVTIGQQPTSAKSAIAVDFDFDAGDAAASATLRGSLSGKFADIRVNDKNITTTAGASHYRVSLLELFDQALEIGSGFKRATSVIEKWANEDLVKGTAYAVAVSATTGITLTASDADTDLTDNVANRDVTIVGLASLSGSNVLATFSKAGPATDAKLNVELSGLTEALMGYNASAAVEFHFAVEDQNGGFSPLDINGGNAYKNWDGSLSQQFQSVAGAYDTSKVYRVQVYAISTFLGPSGQAVTKQVVAYVPTVKPSPANLVFQDNQVDMTFAADPANFPEDAVFEIELFEAEKNTDGDWVKKVGGSALPIVDGGATKVSGSLANYAGTASLKMSASGDYIYSLKYNDGFEDAGAVEVHFAFTLFPISPAIEIAQQSSNETGTGSNRTYNAIYQVTKVPADDNSLTVTGLELRVTVKKSYKNDSNEDVLYNGAELAEAEAALEERAGTDNWVEPETGDKYWRIPIGISARGDAPNLHTISLQEKYWYYAFEVNAVLFVKTVRSQDGYTAADPVDTQGSATATAADLEGAGDLAKPSAPTASLRDANGDLVSTAAPDVTAAYVTVAARLPAQFGHHAIMHNIFYNEQEWDDAASQWVDTTRQDEPAGQIDSKQDDGNMVNGVLTPYSTFSITVDGLTLGNRYFFYQKTSLKGIPGSESEDSALSAAFMPKREAAAPQNVGSLPMADLKNVTITFDASVDEPNGSGAAITGYTLEVRDAATGGNIVPLANGNSATVPATGAGSGYEANLTLASDITPGQTYYAFVKAAGAGLAAAEFGNTQFQSQGVPIIVTNSLSGVTLNAATGERSIVLNNQGSPADALYIMAFAQDDKDVLNFFVDAELVNGGSGTWEHGSDGSNNLDYTYKFSLKTESGMPYADPLSMIIIILSTGAGSAYKQLM